MEIGQCPAMREAGARGRHFLAHCGRCLLASPPLPPPRPMAERRARTLGWTKRGDDDWICPRCIVRDVDTFLEKPSVLVPTSGMSADLLGLRANKYVVRMTCARAPVVMPEGAEGLLVFDRWAKTLGTAGTTNGALRRSLVVELMPALRLPAGIDRVMLRPGTIDFAHFDHETLALLRLRWELEVEARLRPDARSLRWFRGRQTLASTSDEGGVAFDLAQSEAWLLPPDP